MTVTPAPSSTRPIRLTNSPRESSSAVERGALLRRQGDEQPAGGLRVVAENQELLGNAVGRDVRCGELAVAAVAAGLLAGARDLERAVERRPFRRLEHEPHSAAVGHLVRVAEQPEAGHVGDRVRPEGAQHVGPVLVQGRHPLDRGRLLVVAAGVEHERRAERLRQEQRVAGPRARLRPDTVRVHGADDGEPVLRLLVPDRVATGQNRPRRAHLLVGGGQDRRDRLLRQLFRELGDREREQRPAAHREHVVERVRRRDRPEDMRVVDERREEVEREDERGLVVEPVDGGVVSRGKADQQVLGLGGDEPGEELLQPRSRVLGRAAAARDELGQLDCHVGRVGQTTARTAAASSETETDASNRALISPSRPTTNTHGSLGRCHSFTQRFCP